MAFHKFRFYYKTIFVYFYYNLVLKHKDFFKIHTGADETLASHLVVFAAEKARKENRVVTINEDLSFE